MHDTSLIRRAGGAEPAGQRLQRVLADAGVAARRACERLIEEGRVRVNGQVRRELPVFVNPEEDRIEVDGRPIPRAAPRHVYVMLHKPARVLTAGADEPGADRATVTDLVKHHSGARLFAVGRLPFHASGLVLMTNDGEMANRLTHPRYEMPRVYHAFVKGTPDTRTLAQLEKEMHKFQLRENREAGRVRAGRVGLRLGGTAEGKTVLKVTLREGVNRQVVQALEVAGFPVRKLVQVSLGPLELKGLAEGGWRDLEKGELAALRRAVREGARPEYKEVRTFKPGGAAQVRPARPTTARRNRR